MCMCLSRLCCQPLGPKGQIEEAGCSNGGKEGSEPVKEGNRPEQRNRVEERHTEHTGDRHIYDRHDEPRGNNEERRQEGHNRDHRRGSRRDEPRGDQPGAHHDGRGGYDDARRGGYDDDRRGGYGQQGPAKRGRFTTDSAVAVPRLAKDEKRKLLWGAKKIETAPANAEAWAGSAAALGDASKQNKFLRMMGVKNAPIKAEGAADAAQSQDQLFHNLERSFVQGQRRGRGGSLGLGW